MTDEARAAKLSERAASARERREAKFQREEEKFQAMVLREFPPAILEPWQERVAEAGLSWGWEAGMHPLLGAGTALYTLRFGTLSTADSVAMSIALTDAGQDRLIFAAQAIEQGWSM